MKIAVTSVDEGLDAQTSQVFGRCRYFVFVEVEDGEIVDSQVVENGAQNQRGGAGMAAAQAVGNQGAEALITGAVGPNAFNVLDQLGIDVYQAQQTTVKENIDLFSQDELEKITRATGGRGMGRGGGGGRGQGPNR
ncbi:MAG: NifB/NifX family molybdenum-iron cluster-binding protein [Candidatus Aenigmatarchaeota archaeon]